MVNLEYFVDYPLYIIACIPYMAMVIAYYLIFRFYVKVEYLHIINSDLLIRLATINKSSCQKKQ